MEKILPGRIKIYLIIITSYISFLIILPTLIESLTPCLKLIPGLSYADRACNVDIILDRYTLVLLGGLSLWILILSLITFSTADHSKSSLKTSESFYKLTSFLKNKLSAIQTIYRRGDKSHVKHPLILRSSNARYLALIICSILFALFSILAYYQYIPVAEHAAQAAPILLDSINISK